LKHWSTPGKLVEGKKGAPVGEKRPTEMKTRKEGKPVVNTNPRETGGGKKRVASAEMTVSSDVGGAGEKPQTKPQGTEESLQDHWGKKNIRKTERE